jgi:hypothetical protein
VRDCTAFGPQAPQMEIDAGRTGAGATNLNTDLARQVMSIFKTGVEIGN